MSRAADEVVSTGWHWTYGWLRMPGLDEAYGGYAYEDGDGDIMIFKERRYKKAVYLECRIDMDTGQKYICVSHIPRVCNFSRKLKESRKMKKS